jgi:hypothetical protein
MTRQYLSHDQWVSFGIEGLGGRYDSFLLFSSFN